MTTENHHDLDGAAGTTVCRPVPTDHQLPGGMLFSSFPKVPFTVALGVSLSLEPFNEGQPLPLPVYEIQGKGDECRLVLTVSSQCAVTVPVRRVTGELQGLRAQRREVSGWASRRRQQG